MIGHGVGVEMVGMFVGDQNQVGPDFLGRDRRQRQSLEAEEPFDGVGEIRVEIDDFAGGRFEDESRLPQPPQRQRTARHGRVDHGETHIAGFLSAE